MIAGFGLAVLVQAVTIKSYRVTGRSMEPTLFSGDLLLFRKSAFLEVGADAGRMLPPPSHGDVVLIRLHSQGAHMVKRVIALPGDTVSVRRGKLHLNGRPLQEAYLPPHPRSHGIEPPHDWHFSFLVPEERNHRYSPTSASWGPIVVPDGAVFVLGDNRASSGDSRRYGFIGLDEVIGTPDGLVYSFRHLGFALRARLRRMRG